jgi:DNA-binding response OmpR family regulator
VNTEDLAGQLGSGRIDDEDLAHLAKLAEMGLSVAAVVHEARQPLSAIRIALQLAREKTAEGQPVDEFLEDALAQSRRLEDFLERIRDHLQPGEGPSEVRVEHVVRTVVRLLDWQFQRAKVAVEVRIEEGLPPLRADRSQLEQVLQNLLQNARDALVESRGGGKVVLEARRGAVGGIELLVGNQGPGIPRHLADRIFEPFFTTKPRDRGTGLGLFIARRMARRAGGELELVPADELHGVLGGDFATVFRLRLPVEARGPGGGRALVVEDEEAIRRLVSRILEGEGFVCQTAADGEQAIDLLESAPFDLVVTDKNLPGVSGLEVARLARALRPELPVLLITGYASEESAAEAVRLGISDYVLKPIDLDDFRARVRRALGLPSVPPPAAPRVRLTSRPPASAAPREERAALRGGGSGEAGPVVDVLLVEPADEVRKAIGAALAALGCTVAAFAAAAEAEAHARAAGFEVLVAGPALLAGSGSRLMGLAGERALGAIAVMDRAGVDRSIEAIHLGARGMLSPPFESARIALEFRRAVGRLLEERGRPSPGR